MVQFGINTVHIVSYMEFLLFIKILLTALFMLFHMMYTGDTHTKTHTHVIILFTWNTLHDIASCWVLSQGRGMEVCTGAGAHFVL